MELDVGEALRYLGVPPRPPAELRERAEALAERLTGQIRPRHVCRVFPVERDGDGVRLGGVVLPGRTAASMLADSPRAALLCCTLGAAFDALFRSVQARDMADAVILDACGSAWVEAGCGAAEAEIAARFPGRFLTDRFSPGYGDLPLSVQREVCALLDTSRRLGVQVSESCMLNPAKSVTAVVGIADRPQAARIRGCAYCALRETCALRKGGRRCAS